MPADARRSKRLQEVYELLNQNYVEDDDNMFRFDYSVDFLRWCVFDTLICNCSSLVPRALKPPGYRKNWRMKHSVRQALLTF